MNKKELIDSLAGYSDTDEIKLQVEMMPTYSVKILEPVKAEPVPEVVSAVEEVKAE
jgi:hypothetical protein